MDHLEETLPGRSCLFTNGAEALKFENIAHMVHGPLSGP